MKNLTIEKTGLKDNENTVAKDVINFLREKELRRFANDVGKILQWCLVVDFEDFVLRNALLEVEISQKSVQFVKKSLLCLKTFLTVMLFAVSNVEPFIPNILNVSAVEKYFEPKKDITDIIVLRNVGDHQSSLNVKIVERNLEKYLAK